MIELLAPAGSPESVIAAVQNGADAVYLGMGNFNARRGARNFTDEEFEKAVRYCRIRGCKVYVTLNTLVNDREIEPAVQAAKLASDLGADGIIIQDLGLIRAIRAVLPDIPLHASTQMSLHNLAGVEAAAELGLTRAVLARELSLEQIRFITKHASIETEVFCHGALCFCHSGQCYMSALIGRRSGNRGMCAQPCRMQYSLTGTMNEYPLSLKDSCLADRLQELEDAGVSCLKIEGRMKRPEYVAVVTAIYRRLLDEKRAPTPRETKELEAAFSRDGFTDGYYRGEKGAHMLGTRPENARWPEDLFAAARQEYENAEHRANAVSMRCTVRTGEPATLTAESRGIAVTVSGPVPEAARNRAITAEELRTRLGKTGGTAFIPDAIHTDVDEGLALSAGAVNGLRRQALEELTDRLSRRPVHGVWPRRTATEEPLPPCETSTAPPQLTCSIARADQLTAELAENTEAVYIPLDLLDTMELAPFAGKTKLFAVLPRVYRTEDEAAFRHRLENTPELTGAVVGNLGHLPIVAGLPLEVRGDFGLNVFNSRSLLFLRERGLQSATVSFELRHQQVRDLTKYLPCEAIVYGRLPLMITENCAAANRTGCTHGQGCTLTDRTGADFPVLCAYGCRNEIQNSRVLFLADKPEYRNCGLAYARLRFTTESPEECLAVLRRYLGQTDWTPADFTRGLFYRGVD